ncbi:MAG: aldo/keto reductase [Bellilinea sp.]|jgi:aryl-alcohol dehydrogenase-like predicted oxidoreductase
MFKFLGKTGIKVSSLCFGAMSFGGDADESTSAQMYQLCRETGINFFDCANVYSRGKAEEILGNLIHHEREEIILTSKVYYPMGSDVNARGSSRRHIIRAVEASLKRLKTDWIDVYFVHRFDDCTALEQTLRAMDDLVQQGKILYPAASNYAAWQVMKALHISNLHGWAPFEVLQPMYNLVKRQAEVEILPMAQAEQLAVISYSPLGGGLLSGKYGVSARPDAGRLVENKVYQTRYGEPTMYSVAESFSRFALEHGYHPAPLAVAWVAAHPAVTSPIIGARNVEQLRVLLTCLDIKMNAELRDKISSLSITPPPATDRNEENTVNNYGAR